MSLASLVEEQISLNKPFVVYRKPGADHIRMLVQSDGALHRFQDFSDSGFIMAPFLNTEAPILIRPDESHQIVETSNSSGSDTRQKPPVFREPGKERHLNLISNAIKAINSGDLRKVVLARKIVVEMETLPLHVFENLCAVHREAFSYYWYHPQIGSWLGASPELLLSLQDNLLETYSLAGTIKHTEGIKPDWGEKESEEQRLVTDFIVDSLSRISLHASASDVAQVRAGKLWHLRSVIRANASNKDLKKIVDVLHPTPAVCGIPRDKAANFIEKHEGLDRKFYTGFLGEINMGSEEGTNLFVNLRCMEYSGKQASIYVGGGITGLSEPELEWQETEAKSQTILNAIFN